MYSSLRIFGYDSITYFIQRLQTNCYSSSNKLKIITIYQNNNYEL